MFNKLRTMHLFAGAGGGILADLLLGHVPVCAVEIDAYCRNVLLARQRDGCLPQFPIWDDIRTFDGHPWRGRCEIVAGGFPCQDISCAGKGRGIDGDRSGLWCEMFRVVCEVEPSFVFVENSPMLTVRGLGRVLGDLATVGYDAEWCVLGASDVGAPHLRKRIWVLGYSRQKGLGRELWSQKDGNDAARSGENVSHSHGGQQSQRRDNSGMGLANEPVPVSDPDSAGLEERKGQSSNDGPQCETALGDDWWQAEPAMGRVVDGVAHRMDRLKALGNGQVPQVAALAWGILLDRMR